MNTRFKAINILTIVSIFFLLIGCSLRAQDYANYFTGDTTDLVTTPEGGVCMMGGATEDDNAMRWFLQRCNGGDVLVLRASGSNGYNAYLYSQLGVTVNSVETIVFNNANASSDPYIHRRIRNAEAIWFAGGDQWNYISYWRNTPIDSLINDALHNRNIVIGGTSAGMAILGKYYFTAQNGTVTSSTAMGNPYASTVTVDSIPFLEVNYLHDVITDTHYDYYDRRGRQVTFLARILTDWGTQAKGIACDEYTAVCIDTNGIASVYGDSPNSDDNAHFIQTNCEIANNFPEVCLPNQNLQWDHNNLAVKVIKMAGTPTGANTFDLRDWKTANGGSWETWAVSSQLLFANTATPINCMPIATDTKMEEELQIFPNPSANGHLWIKTTTTNVTQVSISNAQGQIVFTQLNSIQGETLEIDISNLPKGLYYGTINADGRRITKPISSGISAV